MYLKTDIYQLPRCVTNIRIDGDDTFIYFLSQSHDLTTAHYACEISRQKNMDLVREYNEARES